MECSQGQSPLPSPQHSADKVQDHNHPRLQASHPAIGALLQSLQTQLNSCCLMQLPSARSSHLSSDKNPEGLPVLTTSTLFRLAFEVLHFAAQLTLPCLSPHMPLFSTNRNICYKLTHAAFHHFTHVPPSMWAAILTLVSVYWKACPAFKLFLKAPLSWNLPSNIPPLSIITLCLYWNHCLMVTSTAMAFMFYFFNV